MKALTLWQPWASAIAVGMKRFETRSWRTTYRGPLAIHAASRRPTRADLELLEEYPLPYGAKELPLGAIVATCTLADVIRCTDGMALDEREQAWGDFHPGRFAWVLVDIVPLTPPVPMPGARGLWEWGSP